MSIKATKYNPAGRNSSWNDNCTHANLKQHTGSFGECNQERSHVTMIGNSFPSA